MEKHNDLKYWHKSPIWSSIFLIAVLWGMSIPGVFAIDTPLDPAAVKKAQQENIKQQLWVIKDSIASTTDKLAAIEKKINLTKDATTRKILKIKK